jgi:hypothetical protein
MEAAMMHEEKVRREKKIIEERTKIDKKKENRR